MLADVDFLWGCAASAISLLGVASEGSSQFELSCFRRGSNCASAINHDAAPHMA
jgi:hypothetical protein